MGAQILGGEALHTRSGRHDHVSTEGVVARNEAHARRQGPHEPTEGGMRRYDVPEEREGERRRRTSPYLENVVQDSLTGNRFSISSGHEDRAS